MRNLKTLLPSLFAAFAVAFMLASCSDEPTVNANLESTNNERTNYSLGRSLDEAAKIAAESISLLGDDNSRSNSRSFDVNNALCCVTKSSRSGVSSDTLFMYSILKMKKDLPWLPTVNYTPACWQSLRKVIMILQSKLRLRHLIVIWK